MPTRRPKRQLTRKKKHKETLVLDPGLVSASSEANILSQNVDFEDGTPDPKDPSYSPGPLNECSPSITPPPAVPRKCAPSAVSLDSDVESDRPASKKLKKKSVKKPVEVDPAAHKLILYIPRAELDGANQCTLLTHAAPFDEALDVIHETIRCADVGKKLALTYKLSNALKLTQATSLRSEDNWTGCLDEVTSAEGEKKKLISVNIFVTDQYLASLRAKLGVKASGTTKGKGKGKKLPILDLEHAESGDDNFDDGVGIMEKEKNFLAELQAKYSRCQLCGPEKACKVDINGNHTKLSTNQLRTRHAWRHSFDTTNDQLSGKFFKNSKPDPAASASAFMAQPPFPFPAYMGMMPFPMPDMQPFGNLSTPVTPTPHPKAPRASTSKRSPALPSSDPPDMGAVNPYPDISEFLHQLDGYQPRRHLLDSIPRFEELDFYNIDEIAKLGTAEKLSSVAGISLGNSTYILEQVRGEMKRVNRARRDLVV
ncbi:hypothetical protein DFH07DRAFT_956341 [Mycena maculata]|uniref:Uncharacterized protein n=1 Tax=Mycena maculata TaxID=230809 RepID=A0AAD7JFT3_9AGAR|nr:hypothetical protein DFH07DRAFT_956341 [Mycena maculata]